MDITNQKHKEVFRKSRAGIVYFRYVLEEVRLPVGYNHHAKRVLGSQMKRVQANKPYYVVVGTKRVYFNDKRPERS